MRFFERCGFRVAPALGMATLAAMLATGFSGCAVTPGASGPRAVGAAPWAAPTSTYQWNDSASDLVARNAVGQFPAFRTFAYMNLAINNAIVLAAAQGLEPDGAAAGAAAGVLVHLFPKDAEATTARLQREIAALGAQPRSRFQSGVEIGRKAAADVVALIQADRASAT